MLNMWMFCENKSEIENRRLPERVLEISLTSAKKALICSDGNHCVLVGDSHRFNNSNAGENVSPARA